MRCAILTVSTSTAAGQGEDLSGPALAERRRSGAEVVVRDILSDDVVAIEAWLRTQVEAGTELILTTGGTGLTPDDVTPEATLAVIEREVPGLAEAMRAESVQYTPMAMLSRAVAGVTGRFADHQLPRESRRRSQSCFGWSGRCLGTQLRHCTGKMEDLTSATQATVTRPVVRGSTV